VALTKVCAGADIAPGEMAAFLLDGWEVVVVRDGQGSLHAIDGMCPHEDYPLVEGDFDGIILTCINHLWSFDVTTGMGINPPACRLARNHVEVRGDDVYVDRERASVAPSG
jgi:toluene monooxygenase system ferredoxin subunit